MDSEMDIERRWNARIPLQLHAALYYSGLGIVKCDTRDISMDGALVVTGRVILNQDASLDIILCSGDENKAEQCRLKANVTRLTADGAGISFRDLSPENYRFLQSIMDAAASNTNQPVAKVFTQS